MDDKNKIHIDKSSARTEKTLNENAEADAALEKKIREFEDYLLSEADAYPEYPSHTLAVKRVATDEQAAALVRDSKAAAEFYRAAGVGKRKALWLAEQFPEISADDRDNETVRAAEEFSRGLAKLKKRMTDHSGHRQRLRASVKRDPDLDVFSDIEILETLLSFFVPRKDTNPLAHELLDRYGSLVGVVRTPTAELRKFRNMTEGCARLLPLLSTVCLWDCETNISLRTPRDAVDYFGSLYHGGIGGPRVAFLDGKFGLIAIERTSVKNVVDKRRIVGSVCKYSAKHVIVTARIDAFSDDVFGLSKQAEELASALGAFGADLLDFLLFTARGFYSLDVSHNGSPKVFLFTPLDRMCAEPIFKSIAAELAEEENI